MLKTSVRGKYSSMAWKDSVLSAGKDFIDESLIEESLFFARNPDRGRIEDILQKSLAIETLLPEETALLLQVKDPVLWEKMRETAARIKKKVYDNRIVTFAPLYLSNLCVNNCAYCGFRAENGAMTRKTLSLEEVRKEAEVLAGTIGHKRLIVVYGEHPSTDVEYIVSTMRAIYDVKTATRTGSPARIRRINVNAPAFPTEALTRIRDAGIGTYQVFQETYHHATYQRLHPAGTPKSDYQWRLYCMHRALEAGIDDVGIGALFGLYDWRFEVMGLVCHARELERAFGIGPHTISFPRIEPALNTPFIQNAEYAVNDDDFKKIVTVLRLSVPYAGMILTARENARMRREVLPLGCTQTDASTRIGVGNYSRNSDTQEDRKQQFMLGDTRSLDEVVRELARMGNITSFCTAGYRCGRTGQCIMELLRSGKEGHFCKLNAILTFREWLDDFASDETKALGEKIIMQEMQEVQQHLPQFHAQLCREYRKVEQGERDIYF